MYSASASPKPATSSPVPNDHRGAIFKPPWGKKKGRGEPQNEKKPLSLCFLPHALGGGLGVAWPRGRHGGDRRLARPRREPAGAPRRSAPAGDRRSPAAAPHRDPVRGLGTGTEPGCVCRPGNLPHPTSWQTLLQPPAGVGMLFLGAFCFVLFFNASTLLPGWDRK